MRTVLVVRFSLPKLPSFDFESRPVRCQTAQKISAFVKTVAGTTSAALRLRPPEALAPTQSLQQHTIQASKLIRRQFCTGKTTSYWQWCCTSAHARARASRWRRWGARDAAVSGRVGWQGDSDVGWLTAVAALAGRAVARCCRGAWRRLLREAAAARRGVALLPPATPTAAANCSSSRRVQSPALPRARRRAFKTAAQTPPAQCSPLNHLPPSQQHPLSTSLYLRPPRSPRAKESRSSISPPSSLSEASGSGSSARAGSTTSATGP